jgi:hypothetical protein
MEARQAHHRRAQCTARRLDRPSHAEGLVAIPTHPAFDAISIDILLADQNPALIRLEHSFPVARIRRGDGGQVVAIASPTTIGTSIHDIFAADIAQIRLGLREEGWDGTSTVRSVIFGQDPEGGFQREIEVAIDPG